MLELFKKLFAPYDIELYPPSGMFTTSHFIALLVIIIIIVVSILFSKKLTKENVKKICKIFALVFTILETIKIMYNLLSGYTWLDAWFPLAYCSLFIYSLYLAGFGKGKIEKLGYSFLTGGGLFAGLFFLIFPTTSFMLHPAYHYLCIYSMLFHGSMIYMCIIILNKKVYELSFKDYPYYLVFITIFSIIAITMNLSFGCNMMFYDEPYNMPLKFVVDIYNFSKFLYTLLIYSAYSLLYGVMTIIYNFIKKLYNKVGLNGQN